MVSNLYMEAIKASNMYYVLVLDVTPPFVCMLDSNHNHRTQSNITQCLSVVNSGNEFHIIHGDYVG